MKQEQQTPRTFTTHEATKTQKTQRHSPKMKQHQKQPMTVPNKTKQKLKTTITIPKKQNRKSRGQMDGILRYNLRFGIADPSDHGICVFVLLLLLYFVFVVFVFWGTVICVLGVCFTFGECVCVLCLFGCCFIVGANNEATTKNNKNNQGHSPQMKQEPKQTKDIHQT